jgi:hypothetical protein
VGYQRGTFPHAKLVPMTWGRMTVKNVDGLVALESHDQRSTIILGAQFEGTSIILNSQHLNLRETGYLAFYADALC